MTASTKSKNELEQIAMAMMMMAKGGSELTEEVGVRTRSTRSSSGRLSGSTTSSPSHNLRRRTPNQSREKQEPVLSTKRRRNHDQQQYSESPTTSKDVEQEPEDQSNAPIQSSTPNIEISDSEVMEEDESIVCAINPMSMLETNFELERDDDTQSHQSIPSENGYEAENKIEGGNMETDSPLKLNDSVYMSSSRRIFRPEFKRQVLDAFQNDPDCVGNQRATARKFGIHRRQVQKWLQQMATGDLLLKKENLEAKEKETNGNSSSDSNPNLNKPSLSRSKVVASRRNVGKVNLQHKNGSGRAAFTAASRPSARSKVKSMPLKGGSSKQNFDPRPSNFAQASGRQNGTRASLSLSTDNGNNSNGSMFMNILASAAAAGNLGVPLSLETPRHFSPRDHSPLHNNNERGSPTYSAGGSSGSGNCNLQNALLLVDELNYLYPNSDFSLLRRALLKEEVSLEKLAHPLMRSKFADLRANINGDVDGNSDQSFRHLGRVADISPSFGKPSLNQQDYSTQQTVDIIRQQQQYFKWLQTCGIGTSQSDLSGLNFADHSNNGDGVPAWFNPLAAAAAIGLPVSNVSRNGKRNGSVNGSESGSGKRKESADNHRFASPRLPQAPNNGKAKTVAAALAATRVQSSTAQQHIRNFSMNPNANAKQSQINQRSNAQKRKPKGRPSLHSESLLGDDDIDPTSMLEVVTSTPSPSSSLRKNPSNLNGHHVAKQRGNGAASNDYNQNGMDLTTSTVGSTSAPSTTRLISKAMNKEYSFLNVLGLVRKNPEESDLPPNGNSLTHTASLENFVQNILPSSSVRAKSPQNNYAGSSSSSGSPPASDLSDSDKTKNMVIEAFTLDPEISGDARAVARKFGLNVRVVMKWLKEGPIKALPQSSERIHENGTSDNNNLPSRINGDCNPTEQEYLQNHKGMLNESNNNSPGSGGSTGVNKRKNSKPNQICDFPTDDDAGLNGALDMVVPIKKRRVSSPNPSPQDV